ncbi:unnamed protein product [Clonostachys rhizophaga]|uniref:Uncharacterized protein n=1 Tax=Clonostachys rhizophaga TaxID=160324 RepID=A0A9N9VHZ1_9HYPO|nr:unnamed protein product [Clonostachys rhizophaga]
MRQCQALVVKKPITSVMERQHLNVLLSRRSVVVNNECQPKPDCGEDAIPNATGQCECKILGALNCGDEADLENGNCVCKVEGQSWNADTSTCSCPADEVVVNSRCEPQLNCGKDSFADESGQCECNVSGALFTQQTMACNCPWGKTPVDGKCQLDCGPEATLDNGHCICNIVVDGNCQLLGCGTAAYAKDGRCEVDCGPDATLKNWQCVCKIKGRTWNANTLKCTCSSRRKATKTR